MTNPDPPTSGSPRPAEQAEPSTGLTDFVDNVEGLADQLDREADRLEAELEGKSGGTSERGLRTDISILLDRSGSMESMRDEAIESFNAFIAEQRELDGVTAVTYTQFDHHFEPVFDGLPLAKVRNISRKTYVPRGMTALLDAIGRTILQTDARIARGELRPELVIVVIVTDGLENASGEFTRERIFQLIREREQEHGWKFMFLGANQDAIQSGQGMGMDAARAVSVGRSKEAYRASHDIMSRKVRAYRRSGRNEDLRWSPAERREAMGEAKPDDTLGQSP